MKVRPSRLAAVVFLAAALFVAGDARPAVAFASVGTVTFDGVYTYRSYTWTTTHWGATYRNTDTDLLISSWTCADSWSGTTGTGSGYGATCAVYLNGSAWTYQTQDNGPSIDFEGVYYNSNGTGTQLSLVGDGPVQYAGPGTLTGTWVSPDNYYRGPVTATYTLTPITTYGCLPGTCLNSYFEAYGGITLHLDYAVH